jgi:RNA polymerase sigma-70 factor, ECF subfamily
MNDARLVEFERFRPQLVRHAYRMLGDYTQAEDVVQDAYLRWSQALERTHVEDDRAFLRATTTRLCLDHLRSARTRREVYVGPWLPEPVVSNPSENPEAAVTLADDVSFALLLALERLSPLERAAFLLHDALDVPFCEIADTLGRTEVAVRQLASRARDHLRESRPQARVPREEAMRLREQFAAALQNDDLAALQELLTSDVVFTSDGGGKVPATTVPVAGKDHVGRMLLGLRKKGASAIHRVELAFINGLPGFVLFGGDTIVQTVALEITEGRIAAIYATRNPDKLAHVSAYFGVDLHAQP